MIFNYVRTRINGLTSANVIEPARVLAGWLFESIWDKGNVLESFATVSRDNDLGVQCNYVYLIKLAFLGCAAQKLDDRVVLLISLYSCFRRLRRRTVWPLTPDS